MPVPSPNQLLKPCAFDTLARDQAISCTNMLIHLDSPTRGEVAPVTQRVRRSVIIFKTVLILAFSALSNKHLFATDACVAAAKAISSNADNLGATKLGPE